MAQQSIDQMYRYVYQPAPEEGHCLVVGHMKENQQFVIGPVHTLQPIGEALLLLQAMGLQAGQLNIFVSDRYEPFSMDGSTNPMDQTVIELLMRLGIYQTLMDTVDHSEKRVIRDAALNINISGIRTNLRSPIHTTGLYYLEEGYISPGFAYLLFANEFAHEWRHFQQFQHIEGTLPGEGLWAEIDAMEAQVQFLERLLGMGFQNDVNGYLEWYRDHFEFLQYEYAQGRGFEGHLDPRNIEGSPLVEVNLPHHNNRE